MMTKELFDVLWGCLLNSIKNEDYMDPYQGLRIAGVDFNMPFLRCIECDMIVFAVIRLLIKYDYTTKSDYGKFTISYVMRIPSGEVPFTISNALTFRDDGKDSLVYALIDQLVRKKVEVYNDSEISRINIRIYLSKMKDRVTPIISDDEIASKLWECIKSKVVVEPKKVRMIEHRKRRYLKHLIVLKPKKKSKAAIDCS